MTRFTLHSLLASAVLSLGIMPGCALFHSRTELDRRQYARSLEGLSVEQLDVEIARLEGELGYTRYRRPTTSPRRPDRVEKSESTQTRYRPPVYHYMASTAVPTYSAGLRPPAMPLRVISGSFSGGSGRSGGGTFQATSAWGSKGMKSPFDNPFYGGPRRTVTIQTIRRQLLRHRGAARAVTTRRTGHPTSRSAPSSGRRVSRDTRSPTGRR